MEKLRWTMGSGFWELDASTPATMEGEARAVPGDPLPLGVSRGNRLSRPEQIHFFQRFMSAFFVPSHSPSSHGFALQRVLALPFFNDWFVSIMGQFNLQKLYSSVKKSESQPPSRPSVLDNYWRHLQDKNLFALGYCLHLSLTPEDTLLLNLDTYGDNKTPRKKAVLRHQFPQHNLTVEAVSPGLFVDQTGKYWDVPFTMAVDLASVGSDPGASYHLCVCHNSGVPKQFDGDETEKAPASLLPGLSVKGALAYKKNIEIWKSEAKMLKMKQPYDIFLSNPHISAAGIIGAAMTACIGDNSVRSQVMDDSQGFKGLCLYAPTVKSALLADLFGSVSFTAQHGNFQRRLLDLTRFHARLDFPSGSKFILGAVQLAQDFFNSQQPNMDAVQKICPRTTVSLQQQIAGPFSFRVDSGVEIDWKKRDWPVRMHDPVFAIEYALQVLGSAKAVAWCCPKRQEFMVELRFYET